MLRTRPTAILLRRSDEEFARQVVNKRRPDSSLGRTAKRLRGSNGGGRLDDYPLGGDDTRNEDNSNDCNDSNDGNNGGSDDGGSEPLGPSNDPYSYLRGVGAGAAFRPQIHIYRDPSPPPPPPPPFQARVPPQARPPRPSQSPTNSSQSSIWPTHHTTTQTPPPPTHPNPNPNPLVPAPTLITPPPRSRTGTHRRHRHDPFVQHPVHQPLNSLVGMSSALAEIAAPSPAVTPIPVQQANTDSTTTTSWVPQPRRAVQAVVAGVGDLYIRSNPVWFQDTAMVENGNTSMGANIHAVSSTNSHPSPPNSATSLSTNLESSDTNGSLPTTYHTTNGPARIPVRLPIPGPFRRGGFSPIQSFSSSGSGSPSPGWSPPSYGSPSPERGDGTFRRVAGGSWRATRLSPSPPLADTSDELLFGDMSLSPRSRPPAPGAAFLLSSSTPPNAPPASSSSSAARPLSPLPAPREGMPLAPAPHPHALPALPSPPTGLRPRLSGVFDTTRISAPPEAGLSFGRAAGELARMAMRESRSRSLAAPPSPSATVGISAPPALVTPPRPQHSAPVVSVPTSAPAPPSTPAGSRNVRGIRSLPRTPSRTTVIPPATSTPGTAVYPRPLQTAARLPGQGLRATPSPPRPVGVLPWRGMGALFASPERPDENLENVPPGERRSPPGARRRW